MTLIWGLLSAHAAPSAEVHLSDLNEMSWRTRTVSIERIELRGEKLRGIVVGSRVLVVRGRKLRVSDAEGGISEKVYRLPAPTDWGKWIELPAGWFCSTEDGSFRVRREPGGRLSYGFAIPIRSGDLTLEGRTIEVRLVPRDGSYVNDDAVVAFDLDGDGVVGDTDTLEDRRVSDHFVEIDGISYRFEVVEDGRAIRLFETSASDPRLRAGMPAPEFDVRDTEGRRHQLSDYRGRYLVIDFWATWCGPCIGAFPEVERWREAHPAVAVVGFAADPPQKLRRWLENRPLGFPSAPFAFERMREAWQVDGIPEYALVGPDGTLLEMSRTITAFDAHLTD